jgi:hypothetical protein
VLGGVGVWDLIALGGLISDDDDLDHFGLGQERQRVGDRARRIAAPVPADQHPIALFASGRPVVVVPHPR